MWWVILGDTGYDIVHCDIKPRATVRGPFRFYVDAEEWRDHWERQEQKRETAAGYVLYFWALFAIIMLLHWIFS